jgi:hypothetical protein
MQLILICVEAIMAGLIPYAATCSVARPTFDRRLT